MYIHILCIGIYKDICIYTCISIRFKTDSEYCSELYNQNKQIQRPNHVLLRNPILCCLNFHNTQWATIVQAVRRTHSAEAF